MKNDEKNAVTVPIVVANEDQQIAILETAELTGVCTNQALTVFKAFGDTLNYLKNENFNFELVDLLPIKIGALVKAATYQALKTNEKVVLNNLNFSDEGFLHKQLVNITIKPYYAKGIKAPQLLILFTSNKKKSKNNVKLEDTDLGHLSSAYLDGLEQELAKAKINLQAAYELVNSSNENVQSFNEELQAANEEMQSSNEELQSVNEELKTINKEQQQTNAELTESNDDLNNYFRSNTNGQLFVDHNLLLKNYSPGTVKHINLRESDIGRPLEHISTNIELETLVNDVKLVMAALSHLC